MSELSPFLNIVDEDLFGWLTKGALNYLCLPNVFNQGLPITPELLYSISHLEFTGATPGSLQENFPASPLLENAASLSNDISAAFRTCSENIDTVTREWIKEVIQEFGEKQFSEEDHALHEEQFPIALLGCEFLAKTIQWHTLGNMAEYEELMGPFFEFVLPGLSRLLEIDFNRSLKIVGIDMNARQKKLVITRLQFALESRFGIKERIGLSTTQQLEIDDRIAEARETIQAAEDSMNINKGRLEAPDPNKFPTLTGLANIMNGEPVENQRSHRRLRKAFTKLLGSKWRVISTFATVATLTTAAIRYTPLGDIVNAGHIDPDTRANDALAASPRLLNRTYESLRQITAIDGHLVSSCIAESETSTPAELSIKGLDSEYQRLVGIYGETLWSSLDDERMPSEVRNFIISALSAVSELSATSEEDKVGPDQILAFLHAELSQEKENGERETHGIRLFEPRRSSAEAEGVGQFLVQTWNGWMHPYNSQGYLKNVVEILKQYPNAEGQPIGPGYGRDFTYINETNRYIELNRQVTTLHIKAADEGLSDVEQQHLNQLHAEKNALEQFLTENSNADPNNFMDALMAIAVYMRANGINKGTTSSDFISFATQYNSGEGGSNGYGRLAQRIREQFKYFTDTPSIALAITNDTLEGQSRNNNFENYQEGLEQRQKNILRKLALQLNISFTDEEINNLWTDYYSEEYSRMLFDPDNTLGSCEDETGLPSHEEESIARLILADYFSKSPENYPYINPDILSVLEEEGSLIALEYPQENTLDSETLLEWKRRQFALFLLYLQESAIQQLGAPLDEAFITSNIRRITSETLTEQNKLQYLFDENHNIRLQLQFFHNALRQLDETRGYLMMKGAATGMYYGSINISQLIELGITPEDVINGSIRLPQELTHDENGGRLSWSEEHAHIVIPGLNENTQQVNHEQVQQAINEVLPINPSFYFSPISLEQAKQVVLYVMKITTGNSQYTTQLAKVEEQLSSKQELTYQRGNRFQRRIYKESVQTLSPFGASVNYQTGGKHTGVDLAGLHGVDLFVPENGTVIYKGPLYGANSFRGPHAIVIDHGQSVYTIYSHVDNPKVEVGQFVRAGDPLATQSNLGYDVCNHSYDPPGDSTCSHLHLEVRISSDPSRSAWTGDPSNPWTDDSYFVNPLDYTQEFSEISFQLEKLARTGRGLSITSEDGKIIYFNPRTGEVLREVT